MILLNSETAFSVDDELTVINWISYCMSAEYKNEGQINYIFCDDDYLLDINVKYLKHNELTDVISFDYSRGELVSGDIFISVERVRDNAADFNVSFSDELHRVMVHGVLHLCGYNDKSEEERNVMRAKEDYYLSLRTFNKK